MEEIEGKFTNIHFVKNRFEANVIGAFKTGFEISETKYMVPIMADLSDMPETVDKLYRKIQEGYDLVIASRYMSGGDKIGGPKFKKNAFKIHEQHGIPSYQTASTRYDQRFYSV